jgi:hypothetical protein
MLEMKSYVTLPVAEDDDDKQVWQTVSNSIKQYLIVLI